MIRPLLFVLLLLPALAHAAPVLKSVRVQHRPAEEVVTLIRGLAPQGVSVMAAGNEVLLRGEPGEVAPLVQAIGKLDAAPKSLIITVREGGAATAGSRGATAGGTLAQPELRVYGTQERDHPETTRQVRTLENQWTRVTTGTAVPVVQQSTVTTPFGTTTQQTTQYKDVESGFEVRPRLAGKSVVVDIRAFSGNLSRQGGGMIDSSSVESTVQGALGQWIALGGSVEETGRDEQGTLYATHARGRRLGHIQIKVELVP